MRKAQTLIHRVNSNLRVRRKANRQTIFVEDPSGFKSVIASGLRLFALTRIAAANKTGQTRMPGLL